MIMVDPCAGVPAPFVERVVAAELTGDEGAGAAGASRIVAEVTCRDGLVVVTARAGAGEPLRRTIDLSREDSQARPRVLSVAIAELVAASREKPVPPPAPPAVAPPPRVVAVSTAPPPASAYVHGPSASVGSRARSRR